MRDLAPGEPGAQHQPVQPVILEGARPQFVERLDEARPDGGEIDRRLVRGLDASAPAARRLAAGRAAAGTAPRSAPAGRDSRPSGRMSESAIGLRGWNRRTVKRCGGMLGVAVETHAEVGWPSSAACSGARSAIAWVGIEAVAIDRREPVAPAAGGGAAFDLAKLRLQGGAQAVAPRGRRLDQRLLELGEIGRRACRGCRASACRAPGRAAESLLIEAATDVTLPCHACSQDRGEAVAQRRIEALARREHQAGREAADRVAAREQRHAPPLLQLQDAQRMVVERVLLDLEQLVARIGVEDGQQRLAVVAVGDRGRSGAARRRPGRAAAARPAPARDRRPT